VVRLLAIVIAIGMPVRLVGQGSRFAVGAGPTWIAGWARWVRIPGAFPITGGSSPGYHLRMSAQLSQLRPWLTVRGEAFYNHLGAPRHWRIDVPDPSGLGVRSAIRDQVFGAGVALRVTSAHRRFSPYGLLWSGIHHTRLGTNPDSDADNVTETRSFTGVGGSVGVGLRLRLGPRHLLRRIS